HQLTTSSPAAGPPQGRVRGRRVSLRSSKQGVMRRIASIGLLPEKTQEYLDLHAAVWPQVSSGCATATSPITLWQSAHPPTCHPSSATSRPAGRGTTRPIPATPSGSSSPP